MKTRPILFSAPMIRALLDGTKTQTRRILKPQPVVFGGDPYRKLWRAAAFDPTGVAMLARCPYGVLGDRLWVREAWRVGKPHDARSPVEVVQRIGYPDMRAHPHGCGVTVLFEAGGWKSIAPLGRTGDPVYPDDMPMPEWAGKLRPSIHMPRAFSRLVLEVVEVRVERLQDISRGDAMDEGCPFANMAGDPDPRGWFSELWKAINGLDSLMANPWVWCVSFKRVEA